MIVDDKGQKVTLRKSDGGWMLPDSQGLPADSEKVSQLLDKLLARERAVAGCDEQRIG